MKIVWAGVVAVSLVAASVANVSAETLVSRPVRAALSVVPDSAFFVGAGGGFNAVDFGKQNVFAVGTSNVFLNGAQTSSGSAAGPASVATDTEANFAPSVQAGYFQKFSGSAWLWGGKFSYSHLGTTSTVRNALLPQAGSFTATGSNTPTPFTGNAVVRAFQTNITHQMMLVPFVGRSFDRSFVYIGAGPTLSRVRTTLNGLIGFADINGARTDVSGAPVDLSSSGWVFGGTAAIGATYFFDRGWFLDVSYTASRTADHTANFATPFFNPNGTGGTNVVGTMVGTSSARIVTQGLTATINRAF